MVCEWGMSEELGPVSFGKREEQVFLGRDIAQHRDYSEETAIRIDMEVRRIVDDNHRRARDMLTRHFDVLTAIANALLERETLNLNDIDQIIRSIRPELIEAAPVNADSSSILTAVPVENPAEGSAAPAADRPSDSGADTGNTPGEDR